MNYPHLFFDLDHTLWDFERNSAESLIEIYHQFELANHGIDSADLFVKHFSEINLSLWNDFDHGRIPHAYIREHRFRLVFEALGVEKLPMGEELGEEYLKLLPQKAHLLDGARAILNHCFERGHVLHIVSNGFDFIQAKKMESAGILHFFQNIVTNEKAGARKPNAQIFAFALGAAQATPAQSLMIGDNWEADVMGALRFGIHAAYYNPNRLTCAQPPTYNVAHLDELREIV